MTFKAICIEINADRSQGLGEHIFLVKPSKGDYVDINDKLYYVYGASIAQHGADLFLREAGTTSEVFEDLRKEK
jgi:hypothetical protein